VDRRPVDGRGRHPLVPRLELNDQFVQYFDESLPFRRDTDFATTHLTGIAQLHYSLAAGTASGINEPVFLHST